MTLRTLADMFWALGLEVRGLELTRLGESSVSGEMMDLWLDSESEIIVAESTASGDRSFEFMLADYEAVAKVANHPADEDALYDYEVDLTIIVTSDAEKPNPRPVEFLARAGVPTLFPFVREAVANLTMRGRFGPVWINPIDVRATVKELIGDPERDGVLGTKASAPTIAGSSEDTAREVPANLQEEG